MDSYRQKVLEAAGFLKTHIHELPAMGLLTGTGLSETAAAVQASFEVAFQDVPHFPVTTVACHTGNLRVGKLHNQTIIAMQGRLHLYEGYSPLEVTFPIRVMQALGVKTLIVTNAAGGLNPEFCAGDIMIISDHINLTGSNPLVGLRDDHWGERFPDMTAAYHPRMIMLAKSAGEDASARIYEGVYVGLKGPSLETPSEARFLRLIGADAVGFSTVLEVITAIQAGMRVLGLSTITNINNPNQPLPANTDEIIAVAKQTAPKLLTIIKNVVKKLRP